MSIHDFEHDGMSQSAPQLTPEDARLVDLLLGRVDSLGNSLGDPLGSSSGGSPEGDLPLDALLAKLGTNLGSNLGSNLGTNLGSSLDPNLDPNLDPSLGTSDNGDERRRAEALRDLLAKLNDYPIDADALADEALVDATLMRVERVDRDLAALPLTELRERHRSLRFRIPDLVGLAAALLLAVGVLMPVTHRMRMASIDSRCEQNMRTMGAAMSNYANDFDGWLPMRAGLLSWDRASSSENMAVLSDLGYCEHGHLNCPGHPEAEGPLPRHGGYAFRALDHRSRARIALASPSALMADRSSVVDFARSGGQVANLELPSVNHGHRGQYILLGTLEVRWSTSPLIPGVRGGLDNVYLIQVRPGTEDLSPGQKTNNPDDHFTH